MRRIVRFMLITTLAVLAVAPLNAQTPTPRLRPGTAICHESWISPQTAV